MRFHLDPSRWTPTHLRHANIHLHLHPHPPAREPTPATPPPQLPTTAAFVASTATPPDPLLSLVDELIVLVEKEDSPGIRAAWQEDLVYTLLEVATNAFPSLRLEDGTGHLPYLHSRSWFSLNRSLTHLGRRDFRLQHNRSVVTWMPTLSLFDGAGSRGPFGALLLRQNRPPPRDWAEEAAYLVGLAQMRRGAGDVLLLALHDHGIYLLTACASVRWLEELKRAPRLQVRHRLVVHAHGPWDLAQEWARECYRLELNRALEGFETRARRHSTARRRRTVAAERLAQHHVPSDENPEASSLDRSTPPLAESAMV